MSLGVFTKIQKILLLHRLLLADGSISECIFLAAQSHFLASLTKKLQSLNTEETFTFGSGVEKMRVECLAQGQSLNDTSFFPPHRIKKYFPFSPVHIFTPCPGIRTGNLVDPSSGLKSSG